MQTFKNFENIVSFTIPGRPTTKKTSQRSFRTKSNRTIVLPSERFLAYEKTCKPYINEAWSGQPIDYGVGIKLKIYLDSYVIGDEVGYMQALGDIFEKHGLISNDMWIHWIDNNESMIMIDKENPRTEVTVLRFRHAKELK